LQTGATLHVDSQMTDVNLPLQFCKLKIAFLKLRNVSLTI